MSSPNPDRDNRANQLNPNNDAYEKSRSHGGDLQGYDEDDDEQLLQMNIRRMQTRLDVSKVSQQMFDDSMRAHDQAHRRMIEEIKNLPAR